MNESYAIYSYYPTIYDHLLFYYYNLLQCILYIYVCVIIYNEIYFYFI